jgi:phosphate starvation-inducible PhoH-like protein
MKKITLPEEGIETLFGSHDANLKHIESILDVRLSTQGSQLIIDGGRADEARVAVIFEQLQQLREAGYELTNGDVKTAADLIVENADHDLRD